MCHSMTALHACKLQIKNLVATLTVSFPCSSQKSYREVVTIVIGLHCQLQKELCVVIEGMALGEVAGTTRYQQTIDGIKPVAQHLMQRYS